MPPETAQPALRRLLPRPAALSVSDDAGVIHRYHAPPNWLPWTTSEPDAVSREVRREQMEAGWHPSMNLVMAGLTIMYVMGSTTIGLSAHVMFAGVFALCFGGGWITLWVAHRRLEANWASLGRQWADAGLGRGRCPICLYSLAGAEAGEAGLARCAECGAAWEAERIWATEEEQPPRRRWLLNVMLTDNLRRSLRDDTGRTFAAQRLRAIATRLSSAEPEAARAVRKVRAGGDPTRIVAASAVGAFFMFPVAALLGMGQGRLPAGMWLMIAVAFVFPAILLIATIGCSELGVTHRARRRGMLAAGLCPVCAGRDLAPNEDRPDLSTCATCGAAWRVDAA